MTNHPFHITITTGIVGGLDLRHETSLVKAALLYADKVTLCSPISSMIFTLIASTNATKREQVQMLQSVLPALCNSEQQAADMLNAINMYEKYMGLPRQQRRNMPAQMQAAFREMDRGIEQMAIEMKEKIYGMAIEAGAEGLADAVNAGLVELEMLGAQETDPDQYMETMLSDYMTALIGAASNTSTYPMYDKDAGDLLNSFLRVGGVDLSAVDLLKGKATGLAIDLIQRLPHFEYASVTEIIDIRRELDSPLKRFRAATIDYAQAIRSVQWDEEFTKEADLLYHQKVVPEVAAIDDQVKSNRYLYELLSAAVDHPVYTTGSLLGMALTPMETIANAFVKVVATASCAAVVAAKASQKWQEKQHAIEQNQLFFYYKAEKLL